MRLDELTPSSVLHVAKNMRDEDALEIYATRFNDDPVELMQDTLACPAFAWVAWLDEPIAAIGAIPMHTGVWSVYAFATPRFPEIAYPLTKFIKRAMMPGLAATGVRRAQCLTLASHFKAHRWLENLGGRRESVLEGYGKDGEDFYLYHWRGQDVRTQEKQRVERQQRGDRPARGSRPASPDQGGRKQH